MKFRILNLIRDILAEILNYMAVVTVWCAVNAIAGLEDNMLMMLGFLTIPILLYIFRCRVQGFFLFTILHIAVPVAVISIWGYDFTQKVVLGIVATGLSVISYTVSIKNDEGENGAPAVPAPLAGGLMFLAMLAIAYMNPDRTVFIPKLALLFAALYLPFMYLEQFIWFDYVNSKTIKNIPTQASLKTGAPIVCGLSLFYLVVSLICFNEKLIAGIGAKIHSMIKAVLAWIFSHFKGEPLDESERLMPSSEPMAEMDFGFLEEEEPPSPLAELIEKIVIILALLIIVSFIIGSIVYLVIKIYKKLHNRDTGKKIKISEDYEEIREKIKEKHTAKDEDKPALFGTYAQRIRRLYVKLVNKYPTLTDTPELYTAREFAGLFEREKQEAAYKFAEMYEKAKYSADECDKDDYNHARRFISLMM